MDLPRLWAGANMEERRKLLLTMIDAVYVDAKEDKCIVAVKPKPAFRPIFEVATTKEGSGVILIKELPNQADPEAPCLWWRRGRVELHHKHGLMKQIILMITTACPHIGAEMLAIPCGLLTYQGTFKAGLPLYPFSE